MHRGKDRENALGPPAHKHMNRERERERENVLGLPTYRESVCAIISVCLCVRTGPEKGIALDPPTQREREY